MYLKTLGLSSTLFALFSITCGFLPLVGQQNKPQTSQQKSERTTDSGHPQPSVTIVEIHDGSPVRTPTADSKQQAAQTEAKPFLTHGEWVMAILTAVYVIISYFALRAIKRQADIGQQAADAATKSADVADRALRMVERAIISVAFDQPFLLPSVVVVQWPISIRSTTKNTGHTRAFIKLNEGGINISERLPEPLKVEKPAGEVPTLLVMAPGESITSTTKRLPVSEISSDEIERIKSGNLVLHVTGRIVYDDEFGDRHITVFTRVYDRLATDRNFSLIYPSEPGYNYAD